MDPRPFRCSYDPDLVKSASGPPKDPKPVFSKPRGAPASDPRLRGPAHSGKRAVPTQLPPARFARRRAREPRVHLSDLGPLVTRVQVSDAARFFGPVKSCELLIARSTNASLGIASIVFGGVPNAAMKAAEQMVAAGGNGMLSIAGVRGVHAALDADRGLLKKAQAQAAAELDSTPPQQQQHHHHSAPDPTRPPSPPPDVNLIELRSLAGAQIDEWYRRFIGRKATYVLIPAHVIAPTSSTVHEVSQRLSIYSPSRIAVSLKGFFIVFETADQARRCFNELDSRWLMGSRLKLALTLEGERIPAAELRELRKKAQKFEDSRTLDRTLGRAENRAENRTLSGARLTLKPDDARPIARATIDCLLIDMKRLAWTQFVRQTVVEAVRRAVERNNETSTQQAGAPATPESDGSDPGYHFETAFGTRMQFRDTGKASRPLPTVRLRKRSPEAAAMRPQKVLKTEHVAPKTYIRTTKSEDLKRGRHASVDSSSESEDESKNEMEHELEDENSSEDENGEYENSDAGMDLADSQESAGPDSIETKLKLEPKLEDGVAKLSIPSSDIEWSPFDVSLPSPPADDQGSLTFMELRQLVHSPSDFQALYAIVDSHHLPPVTENEVVTKFGRRDIFKLDYVMSNWPEQTLPFREAPFRTRSDDERRTYLPVADSGKPNEIVQNYRYRPLYEEEEEIEDPNKVELRKDARVLSRTSFGAGSDLFADDTLSKNVKDVRLARSSIHDWGLYANEHIPEGEFVIEYVGDVLRDEYADVRERNYMMEGIDSSYLFRLDNGTVIDATKRGNGARFINHSCDPNCTAQVFDYDGFKRVVLFSERDIKPDEELTFDYNFVRAQDDEGKVRCACGAANCRGWLI